MTYIMSYKGKCTRDGEWSAGDRKWSANFLVKASLKEAFSEPGYASKALKEVKKLEMIISGTKRISERRNIKCKEFDISKKEPGGQHGEE